MHHKINVSVQVLNDLCQNWNHKNVSSGNFKSEVADTNINSAVTVSITVSNLPKQVVHNYVTAAAGKFISDTNALDWSAL